MTQALYCENKWLIKSLLNWDTSRISATNMLNQHKSLLCKQWSFFVCLAFLFALQNFPKLDFV